MKPNLWVVALLLITVVTGLAMSDQKPGLVNENHVLPIDMQYAVRTGDWEQVKRLVALRPSLVETDLDLRGITYNVQQPLFEAAKVGQLDVVEVLLRHKARANWPFHIDGPLHLAIQAGHAPVVKRLLEAGADPNQQGGRQRGLPMVMAVESDRADIVRMLLEHKADPDSQSLLHFLAAADHPNLEVARVLIDGGSDVNAVVNTDMTPLHYAIKKDTPTSWSC